MSFDSLLSFSFYLFEVKFSKIKTRINHIKTFYRILPLFDTPGLSSLILDQDQSVGSVSTVIKVGLSTNIRLRYRLQSTLSQESGSNKGNRKGRGEKLYVFTSKLQFVFVFVEIFCSTTHFWKRTKRLCRSFVLGMKEGEVGFPRGVWGPKGCLG